MIELTINDLKYNLKSKFVDVPLSAYLAFMKYHNRIVNDEKEISSKIEKSGYEPTNEDVKKAMINMACAVSGFLEIDEEIIFNIPIGEVKGYFDLLKRVPVAHKNLKAVYHFIISLIMTYEPPESVTDYEFSHTGEDGVIRNFTVGAWHHKKSDDLLISETIELMEIQRLAKKYETSESDDIRAQFTAKVTMLAVLCKEDDEVWPDTQSEIDALIEAKKAIFKNVNAKTMLDVGFFLNGTFKV